jgi:3-deoxy-D-manno-octulosonic-acid transferase
MMGFSDTMTQLVYNFFLTASALFALPFTAFALALRPRYRLGLSQRLGVLPADVVQRLQGKTPVWLHAPSVGEMLATRPFLRKLKQVFPHHPLVLSCLTPTAYATTQEKITEADAVIYFPLDHPLFVERVLSRITPSLFLFTETEMWPNFLTALAQRDIPAILVSGRFSARAATRYRWLSPLFMPIFRDLTLCCMQTQADADRLVSAGADPQRVVVTGNFKVDGVTAGDWHGQKILAEAGLADRPVLIGASTHASEEEILLAAYRQLQHDVPQLLLILAPRHPQRFAEVERLLQTKGYRYSKRSQPVSALAGIAVFLLDTLGELASLYSTANLVFVGGSLIKGPGGHSVIEPALAQVPVCFGPHTHNFTTVVEELIREGGGFQVTDTESLVQTALPLLTNASVREEAGKKALAVIRRGQGAVERTIEAIIKNAKLKRQN